MTIDYFVVFEVVAAALFSGFICFLWGSTYEMSRSAREREREALEAKQQKMWNEYINALKEGKK